MIWGTFWPAGSSTERVKRVEKFALKKVQAFVQLQNEKYVADIQNWNVDLSFKG